MTKTPIIVTFFPSLICYEFQNIKLLLSKSEMVRQPHQLNGHEFKQAPGDSKGQESLVCCSP